MVILILSAELSKIRPHLADSQTANQAAGLLDTVFVNKLQLHSR
jgi:hypothetical protein